MAATQIDLNDILAGIQSAVTTAQHLVENQHQDELSYFFNDDGTPKTKTVILPNMTPKEHWGAGEGPTVTHAIPLLCLVPIHTIQIKELKVKFKAQIGELSKPSEDKSVTGKAARHRLGCGIGGGSSWFGSRKREDLAEIEITFAGTDPPEGIVRVNKELLKRIP